MINFGNRIAIAIDNEAYERWVLLAGLDHFFNLDGATQVYPENAVDDSILAKILSESDPANISDYNNATDSLEAIGTAAAAILVDTAAIQPIQEGVATKVLTTIMNGNNDIFVVAGGPVKIIELIGIVTTELEAKGNLINYNMDPTSPAGDTVFGTDGTALEVTGDTVGTIYTWNGTIANDLVATPNGVGLGTPAPLDGSTAQTGGLVVPAGSLELASIVATSATGEITFYIRYTPLVSGATVTAAP